MVSWAVLALVVSLGARPASAQVSGIGVAVVPSFDSPVVVGQEDASGLLQFVNTSAGAAASETVTLSGIHLNPSCAVAAPAVGGPSPCPTPEPRPNPLAPILHLGVVSAAGTTCPGGPFTISGPDGDGDYSVTPNSGPATLAPGGLPGSSCIIRFTFDTVQRPTDGSTAVVAVARASSPSFPGGSLSAGAGRVTVNRASPTLTTSATPQVATAGTAVTDVAFLAGGASPTGTVTFRLYSDAACTVEVFNSTNPYMPASATATSSAVVLHAPGTYHWRATYSGDAANSPQGPTPCDDPAETVTIVGAGRYTALSPIRIEDTRVGAGGLAGALGPGSTAEVQVTGRGRIPSGASAVALNVTVTQPTGEGFLTMYPSGTARPLASNLNFTPGKTVPNLVVVKVGAGGRVALFNSAGTTHVIVDVAGYFSETATGGAGRYQPLVPARIADTRFNSGGVRLGPGQSFDLQVTGQGGAPAPGVSAAVLNVAATGTTAESYLTIYPTGEPRPHAANLNFAAGDTVSNRTMTKVGAGGKVTIYNNAGATDVVVDIGGTYTDASVAGGGGGYTPVPPARVLDTRVGSALPSGGRVDVQVAGEGGVPETGVTAVILSVTVTHPAGAGFLTIFPSGAARPLASDLNYAAGETRANLVVVQLPANGKVGLFTSNQAHVIFDVAGYFT